VTRARAEEKQEVSRECSPRTEMKEIGRIPKGAAPAVVLGATGPHGDGGTPVVNPRWEAALRLRLVVLELLAALFSSGCEPRRRPGGEQGGGRNCRAAAATLCSCAARARRGPAQAGRRLGRGARG
jgi:hypothetical protein